ncbi:MAG: ABC transporter substrate-binding protein [Actinomycetota bacterium]
MAVGDLSGRRLGGFELIEPLGEGSFAAVWRARQVRLDRDVAVKVLDPIVARDPTTARRFEREGRAAANLDHPAIVPVYEAGDDDGLYYLAMRLVDGETLADLLDRESPLPLDRVLALLAPVAAALDHAHAAGLVHRDVKPANILLEGDRVYLTDFGIAASAREVGRYTTGSIGTADYMAPEQARGDDLDHRADLYALGCVAYHALTGAPPFRRDDLVATLVAHGNDPIPPTGVPGLDAFFDRALAKEPDERFDRGVDLVRALASLSPVAPDEPPRRAEETPRRRSLAWVAVAALTVIAFAAATVVVIGGGDDAGAPSESPTGATAVNGSDPPSTEPAATDPTADGPSASDPPTDGTATSDGSAGSSATTEPIVVPTTAPVEPSGRIAVGTTLDLADPNAHRSLDTVNVLAEWVLPVMYRVDENLDLVPSLATGPPTPIADDPLRLQWEIRDDITWDDGTPVTTADIVATYQYLTDPATNATNISLYGPVSDVRAIDNTMLEIDLSSPIGVPRVLFSTTHPIIQAAAWQSHLDGGGTAADFLDDGVTFAAGPFRAAPNAGPGEIELLPNPEWSGDPERGPKLESIRIVEYPTTDSLIEALGNAQIDVAWADTVGNNDVRDVQALPDTQVLIGTSDTSIQLTHNAASPALADARVREAIQLGLDRDEVGGLVTGLRTGDPAERVDSLVFAPGQSGGSDPFGFGVDRDLAAQLLDEAGWVEVEGTQFRQRDGETLTLDLLFLNTAENLQTGLSIVSQLEALGIDVVAEQVEDLEVGRRMDAREFDTIIQFRLFNSDPIATRAIFGTEGQVNLGGFSDPEIDALLDAADAELDPDVRLDLYDQIDVRLEQLDPALPLFALPAFTAYDARLTGIQMAPNRGPLVTLNEWTFAS